MTIKQNVNFHKLFETDVYVVGNIYEEAFLINKQNEDVINLGDIYGEPNCALIDKDNKWCLVGGATLIHWSFKNHTDIKNENLCWIFRMRQTDLNKVEILIDPWSENPAIWELDTFTFKAKKLSDFNNYKGKEFTESVIW